MNSSSTGVIVKLRILLFTVGLVLLPLLRPLEEAKGEDVIYHWGEGLSCLQLHGTTRKIIRSVSINFCIDQAGVQYLWDLSSPSKCSQYTMSKVLISSINVPRERCLEEQGHKFLWVNDTFTCYETSRDEGIILGTSDISSCFPQLGMESCTETYRRELAGQSSSFQPLFTSFTEDLARTLERERPTHAQFGQKAAQALLREYRKEERKLEKAKNERSIGKRWEVERDIEHAVMKELAAEDPTLLSSLSAKRKEREAAKLERFSAVKDFKSALGLNDLKNKSDKYKIIEDIFQAYFHHAQSSSPAKALELTKGRIMDYMKKYSSSRYLGLAPSEDRYNKVYAALARAVRHVTMDGPHEVIYGWEKGSALSLGKKCIEYRDGLWFKVVAPENCQ